MSSRTDDHGWQTPPSGPGRDELLDPSTQIVADADAYLGQGRHDVGRRISEDQVELFISADVAGSLQMEFVRHAPEFVALHDLGTSAGLRLLTSLAGAAGARVQRLSVRRQGHGVALAVLQFVEMPMADGVPVRVYATDIHADSPTRAQVARVLLAFSRLGVLLVGELPPLALAGQLQPLHEALRRGPWPNRELLLMPLGSSTALAAQASQLVAGSPVAAHVTPHADRPRQAWTYIGGAWNRLHATQAGERLLPTDMALVVPPPRVPDSQAATEPMPLHSLPGPRQAAPVPMPRPGGIDWQAYVERCVQVKGTVAVCVFDSHSSKALAQAGGPPASDRLAQQGAALLAQMNDATRALGLGTTRGDAAVSTSTHHLLLRAVPGHVGIVLHLVLSASTGNLTLARMQLDRIEAPPERRG